MKANELRIGNLLKLNDTGETFTVTVTGIMQDSHGVKVFGITPDGTYCNEWIEHCKQITLTLEWLERLGFGKYRHIKDGIVFDRGWLRINESMVAYWRGGYIDKIKHVHQLQNIFFCLTGTELTLTEPK